jgi:hypothetical protein
VPCNPFCAGSRWPSDGSPLPDPGELFDRRARIGRLPAARTAARPSAAETSTIVQKISSLHINR